MSSVMELTDYTPWSRDLPEKLTVPQLVKKLPMLHGTRRFIITLTTANPLAPILSHINPVYA